MKFGFRFVFLQTVQDGFAKFVFCLPLQLSPVTICYSTEFVPDNRIIVNFYF